MGLLQHLIHEQRAGGHSGKICRFTVEHALHAHGRQRFLQVKMAAKGEFRHLPGDLARAPFSLLRYKNIPQNLRVLQQNLHIRSLVREDKKHLTIIIRKKAGNRISVPAHKTSHGVRPVHKGNRNLAAIFQMKDILRCLLFIKFILPSPVKVQGIENGKKHVRRQLHRGGECPVCLFRNPFPHPLSRVRIGKIYRVGGGKKILRASLAVIRIQLYFLRYPQRIGKAQGAVRDTLTVSFCLSRSPFFLVHIPLKERRALTGQILLSLCSQSCKKFGLCLPLGSRPQHRQGIVETQWAEKCIVLRLREHRAPALKGKAGETFPKIL